MNRTFRIGLYISPLFFLTSCFSLDSTIVIGTDGKIRGETIMDISKMATIVQSMSSGTTNTGNSMNPRLCEDKDFRTGMQDSDKVTIVKCTDLADYKAKIETEVLVSDVPEILMGSGFIIVDALRISLGSDSPALQKNSSSDNGSEISSEDFGIHMTESLTLPWSIVYKDGGTMSGSNTINIDLTDKKISKKKEFYIIATAAGNKLRPVEVNKLKQKLRAQIRKAKLKAKRVNNNISTQGGINGGEKIEGSISF